MAIITVSGAFFNYIKANTIVPQVFYIESDGKTKSPYLTIQQVDDPNVNNILCQEDGETYFLISIFQKSYTTGINNRQLLINYIKGLRGQTIDNFNIYNVSVENSWDGDKNIDGLYNFNCEIKLSWKK